MKSKNILIILILLTFGFSTRDLLAQAPPPPPDTVSLLTSVNWKLKEIQVDTNSYTDPTSTDLSYAFKSTGSVYLNGDTVNAIPWRFANNALILLNEGTTEQQTFNIDVLTDEFFIYNANYTVNDTLYNYKFKMVGF